MDCWLRRFKVHHKIYIYIHGATIAWKLAKQTCISRFLLDAEMIALDSTEQHAKLLEIQLIDIPLMENPIPPMSIIRCNNQAAIAKAKQKHSDEPKMHIHMRLKILRYLQRHGVIALEYT